MERVFVPWWILLLTTILFLGLAFTSALEQRWLGVLVGLALAALSGGAALVHRNRLRRLERSNHPWARKP